MPERLPKQTKISRKGIRKPGKTEKVQVHTTQTKKYGTNNVGEEKKNEMVEVNSRNREEKRNAK